MEKHDKTVVQTIIAIVAGDCASNSSQLSLPEKKMPLCKNVAKNVLKKIGRGCNFF